MNLGKLAALFFLLSQLVLAEGVPFQVSSKELKTPQPSEGQTTENIDPESGMINDLKYMAISNWLQSYLGPRFTQFDRYVTPEFAEKYILDYKVTRSNPPGAIELIGHLDGDSLKKWVRLVESKNKGSNQIKPLWIVSSNLPAFNLSPSEMSTKIKDSTTLQLLSQLTQNPFQKLNTRIAPLDSSINLEAPPKNESEIQSLTSWAARQGDTLVVWEAFTTCSGCSVPRFDIFVYNTKTQELAFAVGDDVTLSSRDLSNSEVLKRTLLPVFQQFQAALENSFSEGTIQDVSFKIIFENVDSYRTLKMAESSLSRDNGISSLVFKRARDKTAEYAIKSSLTTEELAQKLQNQPGFKAQVSRVDSSTLSVKFLR